MDDDKLGKYEIRSTLGRGAMGIVYEGWDPTIARKVAIKTVRLPDASDLDAQEELERFKREAQAAGRLSHPNIVGVFDYGETSEIAYIVMEYIDGESLKSLLEKQERLPVAQTVRVMEELLAGLQFSHDRGVVHRDIKPGNVMITKAGQVKIADFGIARIESSSMTQAGTVLGTPAYMSPEQFMGQTVDARTDIYSAGVVLYQLLTGERPFEGSMTAIMHKALNTTPPRPSALSVTAPGNLDPVVERAMAKRPEQRYASAAEFARALRDAVDAPVGLAAGPAQADPDATLIAAPKRAAPQPPPPPPAPVAAPKARRNKALLAIVAVVVLALLGGGAWFLFKPAQTAAPAEQAQSAAPTTTSMPETKREPPPLPVQTATAPPTAPPPEPSAPTVTAPATPPAPPAVSAITVPAPPPAPVAPPAPTTEQLRSALATLLPTLSCTLTSAQVSDPTHVIVQGIAGAGAPAAALHHAIADAVAPASITWNLKTFSGPYCDALDALHPISDSLNTGAPLLGMVLKSTTHPLPDGSPIVLDMKMPNFPSYLQVDYLSNDGTMAHFYPSRGAPVAFPAGASVPLGEPDKKTGFAGWQVGPPYGTDMVIAIAASAPLFAKPRPDDERPADYLRALQAAIEQARRRGDRVVGQALTLETAAR